MIDNDRRYYLTLPDKRYKEALIEAAGYSKQSVSKYIVSRLDLLKKIESDPVGSALVANLNGKRHD